jgi:replication factor C large subunit
MSDLWVDRYKPEKLEGIVGNRKIIEEGMEFVNSFKRQKTKALFFHGPTGVGKTLLAELLAKESNHFLVEVNASDERNSDKIESYISSLKTQTLFSKGKIILIDEVDGLSRRDRGAASAIVKLIKESKFPVLITGNDPYIPKLSPLRKACKLVKFNKIPSPSVEKFLRSICEKEGISVKGDVLKSLSRWCQGDLRSAINDLQTVSKGKSVLEERDMESLGYRERGYGIYDILPTLLRSKNISASRKLIYEGDKDSDEVLWWIENNLDKEFSGEAIANALNILSKADIFRARVMKQQNWRFKGFMVDMLAGVSLAGESKGGYVSYAPPTRFIQLARSRGRRALMDSLCRKIGAATHSSKKAVKRDFLPYWKIILKKQNPDEFLDLEREEIDLIIG